MKPSNFPERKNARRKAALARLYCQYGNAHDALGGEGDILSARCVPSARHVQTKKFGGRIARQSAWARGL